ncbi:lysophospholipid acyltransferase family protein [Candidatus Omnitrophota bacterium]
MAIYWLTKFLFGAFARICFRLKVEGLENLPKQGGLILAANHASSLDPFILIAAIPRYVRWLIVYEFYDVAFLRPLLRAMRFIRLANNLPKTAFRALQQGEMIGAFPEGRRSWGGAVGPGRPGVAALARKTGVAIVPVAIVGSYDALPRTGRGLRLRPITVRIGEPLRFPAPAKKSEAAAADQENIAKLMQTISHLLQR